MYYDEDESWEMLDPVHALHACVSLVILTVSDGRLQVLMRNNQEGPYTGKFVLPNSVLREDNTLEEAAEELGQSHGFAGLKLAQSGSVSSLRCDPRSRVMTVGFTGAVPIARLDWVALSNDFSLIDIEMEGDIALLSLGGAPAATGFFHEEVVGRVVCELRRSIEYTLMQFSFLERTFTYPELVSVHEAILGEELVPQWIRRKISKRVFEGDMMVVGTGVMRRERIGRPAELFELKHVSPNQRRLERQKALARNKIKRLEREAIEKRSRGFL